MAKASNATVKARVEEILTIMLDGAEPWDIRLYVSEKQEEGEAPWTIPEGENPLSERQIRRYCELAEKEISASHRTNRRKLLRRHLAQRRSLFAKAVQQGDIRAALACAADEARLQRLYDPPPVKPKSSETDKPLTAADVLRALSQSMIEITAAPMDAATRGKLLVGLGAALLQALNVEDFGKRLAALEAAAQRAAR